MKEVLMEKMTWPEIEQAMQGGVDTALVVAASIEQHGPHLPTATDTIIGQHVAEAVARQLGRALVAPVIRPALSRHHIGFPGTITLKMKTFIKVLEDYIRSLNRHGFKNVILFVSHGGNSDALQAFTPFLAKKAAGQTSLLFVYSVERNIKSMHEYLTGKGVTRGKAGVHAGLSETSLMLYLTPHLVHMDLAAPGLTDESFYLPENISRSKISSFIHGIRSQSDIGVLGDPIGSTAQIGQEIFKRKVNDLVQEIQNNLPAGGGCCGQ